MIVSLGWKRAASCMSLLVVVAYNPLADAYVLSGKHLLKLMIEQQGQSDSLYIHQKVIFYNIGIYPTADRPHEEMVNTANAGYEKGKINGGEHAANTVAMEESLRYLFPQRFRSEITTDENQRIHVFADGEALTAVNGAVQHISETRFDLYKDILLLRSRTELEERLTHLGLDLSVTSLGRLEGQIAFVIGATYPNENITQLWLDKESLHPLRWIITSTAAGFQTPPVDIRYSEWWQLDDTLWYPMRIEFFLNDQLIRLIKVQRYERNVPFSKDMFDISRLRSTYSAATVSSVDTGKTEDISEVQQTIEEFRKLFE